MEEISNFIRTIMQKDLNSGKVKEIVTRFPPEPNSYLHIGHARAIVTNFELAKVFNGKTNLRFDDTNPSKEGKEYVEGIQEDLAWLGYKPASVLFGSDYFDKTYEKAILLINKGLAYVDDLNAEQMSKYRGTIIKAGKNSPFRDRTVEENLKLFHEMRDGKYADGEKTLRAKIDMAHPNINMRDPAMYRIMHKEHHRQGNKWCIYPMYDFAHPLQDSFEGVTHSLCSIEFDNHRIIYDWFIEKCEMKNIPHQYEFGRLQIANTVLSKRYLRSLVESGKVNGFDDPRMPTLRGLARRGFTAESIKKFILSTGLSRVNSTTEAEVLENFLRDDIKMDSYRPNAITNPLKVILTNYPEGKIEYLDCPNNQENDSLGIRKMAFGRELYIEREDFLEVKPNKKWKRLSTNIEVRLLQAYFIKCNEVIKDEAGKIIELHCTYAPETKSGSGFNDRKPNGNIHYVEASTAIPATFRSFESLLDDKTEENKDFELIERFNKDSLIEQNGYVEEFLKDTIPGTHYQFMRNGYFVTDQDTVNGKLVFNKTCSLKSKFKKKK